MRKFALFCSVLCLSATMFAQSTPQPQRLISEVNIATPKPGMTAQFEAGRKAHSAFHAAQKINGACLSGKSPQASAPEAYLMASPGHHWAELTRELISSSSTWSMLPRTWLPTRTQRRAYYAFRDDLSLSKPPATPSAMRTAAYYTVIPGHMNDFIEGVKKINAATQKMNDPTRPSRVYSLSNGGNAPQFVLITERAKWADMEPLGMTLDELMKAAYGDDGKKIMDDYRASIASVRTEMAVLPRGPQLHSQINKRRRGFEMPAPSCFSD